MTPPKQIKDDNTFKVLAEECKEQELQEDSIMGNTTKKQYYQEEKSPQQQQVQVNNNMSPKSRDKNQERSQQKENL